MPVSLSFMLDAAILLLLAGTIFLAFRLNLNLRHFREGRKDMEKLVATLSVSIERAEKAIAGLQISARNSGADLDKKVKETRFLVDELKFMGEAGDNLAARLEKLADRNRELVEKIEHHGGLGPGSAVIESTIVVREQERPAQAQPVRAPELAGFSIHDREFEDEEADEADDLDDLDAELDRVDYGLSSQAEREFFEALQKRKGAGGRS